MGRHWLRRIDSVRQERLGCQGYAETKQPGQHFFATVAACRKLLDVARRPLYDSIRLAPIH